MSAGDDRLVIAAGGLRSVPGDCASYDIDAATAQKFLRFSAELLDRFAVAGVPHRHGLFDYTDLTNIALASGLGTTVPELARRFLMRFVMGDPSSWLDTQTWNITVTPPQPIPGRRPWSSWQLLPIDAAAPGITVHGEPRLTESGLSVTVTISGSGDQVTDRLSLELYEETLNSLVSGEVLYQTVPESLRQDHQRAWGEGTADCVVVSRYLAERLNKEGRTARARRGYLLGLLGSDHAWTEVFEEGRWKCLDPVFELLAASTAADTGEFQQACRGARFNRLVPCTTDTASPLVEIDGRPAPAWALASVSVQPWRGDSEHSA